MKKTLTTMALVAVLGVMAVSCHKEQMNETMRQASASTTPTLSTALLSNFPTMYHTAKTIVNGGSTTII